MIRLSSLKAARNVRPAVGSAASIAEIIENQRRAEMVAEILFGLFGDRLEGAYAQMDAAQWNPDHHPRGKGGRFVAKGTAAEVDDAKKVVAKVLRGDTDVDPIDTGRHLSRLNVRQLRDLHREHGQKIKKTHLRQQIVDRVRETATGSQWYGQATTPKPQPAPAAAAAMPAADVAKEQPTAATPKPKRITKEQYITKLQDIATRHVREFDAWKEANGAVGADNWKGPRPYAVSTAYVYHMGGVKNAERNLARAENEIVDSIEKFKAEWNARRQAREADQAKEAAQAKPEPMPTPAAGGFKPIAVPGEQMGLFSTEEVKTGQKQLFNIARDSKRGGGKSAEPERSTLEKIADEHKQRSIDNAPLAGQKTIDSVSAFGGKSYSDLTDEQKRGNSHLMTREQKLAAIAEREQQDAADEAYREKVRQHQAKPSQQEIQRAADSVQKLGNSYNPGGTHPGMYPTRAEAVAKAINSERQRAAGIGQGYDHVKAIDPAEIRQAIKNRPASTPEPDRPVDPIKTAAAIAAINKKHGDGLTEANAVPASMQRPADAAKSILRTTPKQKAAAEPRQSRSAAELADAAATLAREVKRSPATVERTLRDALAFHTQSIAEREAAKAHARKVTGLNAGNLAKFENSLRDHSTAFNWDRKARAVAMEVPELGLDPDGHDTPAKVWDLIREGKARRPSANDPEVISTAREWLSKPRRPKTTPADFPADNGFDVVFGDAAEPTRVKRGRVKDSSGVGYVPFSRARAGAANRIGSALVAALAAGRSAKPPTLHAGRFRDTETNVGICRLRAKSAKRTRTFKGVAYTGGVMHPSITIDGVTRAMDVVLDLDSLTIPSMVRPVLDDHDETTHGLIGQTRLIRREGQRLVIEGTLYGWKLRAKEIIAAARAGHQWQLSVGTDGFRLEDIPAGQRVTVNGQTFVGPVKVARGAYLTDFSFVAVGADDHTSAVIAASRGRRPRRPRRSERDEFCTVAT